MRIKFIGEAQVYNGDAFSIVKRLQAEDSDQRHINEYMRDLAADLSEHTGLPVPLGRGTPQQRADALIQCYLDQGAACLVTGMT